MNAGIRIRFRSRQTFIYKVQLMLFLISILFYHVSLFSYQESIIVFIYLLQSLITLFEWPVFSIILFLMFTG